MLQIENLCTGYDNLERLHQVSAEIQPGKLTAVIGPNGCEKSTLMKCLAGLLKISNGTIQLDGQDFKEIPKKERARFISYMPQSRITPDISVRQLVTHGR